jgi:hypothetical protein
MRSSSLAALPCSSRCHQLALISTYSRYARSWQRSPRKVSRQRSKGQPLAALKIEQRTVSVEQDQVELARHARGP